MAEPSSTSISDDTLVTIPVRNLIGMGIALVLASTAFVTTDSRLNSIETNLMMISADISKNSQFRERWPTGEWGSGMLPSDSEQFLRLEALERDFSEVQTLREQIVDLKIELGTIRKEIAVED